jgi:H+/Cl- antiporter ClcA
MLGEVDFEGVYVPSLLVCGVIAILFSIVLQRILLATAFYRLVWHRALFDIALFTIVLACVVNFTSNLLKP